ncbi:MAG: hypothetical protein Q4B26_00440 [Eubacteriales bacterium]|nr:hypothetical protein [Eubacteriales bacterium]
MVVLDDDLIFAHEINGIGYSFLITELVFLPYSVFSPGKNESSRFIYILHEKSALSKDSVLIAKRTIKLFTTPDNVLLTLFLFPGEKDKRLPVTVLHKALPLVHNIHLMKQINGLYIFYSNDPGTYPNIFSGERREHL